MKICTKCKESKDLFNFSTNKQSKDGLHSWCKPCVNLQKHINKDKYSKTAKIYRLNNAEKLAIYEKERRLNPDFKAKKAIWDKTYREKAGEELKKKKRLYYADKQHLRRSEYQRNKQGYIARAYQRLYKIKNLTPENADKKKIQCFYNQAKKITNETGIKHEVDHIIPISKGGLHHQDNLRVITFEENRKKGNKL